MKEHKSILVELPEQTLFDRITTARVLGIGVSTLDSLITPEELPRIHLKKRTYFLRSDIENYILSNRVTKTGGR